MSVISVEASLGTCQKALRLKSSELVWNVSCGDTCPAQQTMGVFWVPPAFAMSVQGKRAQPPHLRFSAGVSTSEWPILKQASPRMRLGTRPWLSALCPVVHRAVFASRAHQDMLGPAPKAIKSVKTNERFIHRIPQAPAQPTYPVVVPWPSFLDPSHTQLLLCHWAPQSTSGQPELGVGSPHRRSCRLEEYQCRGWPRLQCSVVRKELRASLGKMMAVLPKRRARGRGSRVS